MKKNLIPVLLGRKSAAHIWTARSYALEASQSADELAIQEPSVIYEGGTWKMWYSYGYTHTNRHMGYATSSDGINFSRYGSNPVVSGYTRAYVFKDGSTYVMFAIDETGGTGHHKLTSADGISWSNAGAISLTGTAKSFESAGLANICVWIEGSTWHMIYEASNGTVYALGHATSVNNGMTWARDTNNPILSISGGSVSGPFLQIVNGVYILWAHIALSGALPTDIVRYRSSDLASWTRDPANSYTISRVDMDDGVGTGAGQEADLHLVEVNGVTYAYTTSCYNGGLATAGIRVFTTNKTIAQIVKSKEGMSGSYQRSYLFNGGFERVGAGGADVFEKWTETASDGAIARTGGAWEFKNGTSGLYGVKLTAGANKNTQVTQSLTVGNYPASTTMTITGWARGDGTNRPRVRAFGAADLISDWSSDTTRITNGTTWTQFACSFTSPASGTLAVYLYCPNAAGGIGYFDDVKLLIGA